MRKDISTGYFLSSMLLFNLTYTLSNIHLLLTSQKTMANLLMCLPLLALTAAGIATTIGLLANDDSVKNAASTGRIFLVQSSKEYQKEEILFNISTMELLAILFPVGHVWQVILFLLIECVYFLCFKDILCYSNPVMTLFGYKVFECTGCDKVTGHSFSGTYIFFIKTKHSVKKDDVIRFKNISFKFIRLNDRH